MRSLKLLLLLVACCQLLLPVAVVVARTQNIEKSDAATQLSVQVGVGVKSEE